MVVHQGEPECRVNNWVAIFKVKVTVRAYIVNIWKHFGDLCFHLYVYVFECMI